MSEVYSADRSLKGKLRRRLVRFIERRPAVVQLDRPLVSFSFDDVLESATGTAARILESRGVRGTYYVSAGLAGDSVMGRYATRNEIQAVGLAGHEIACHTYSHLDCGQAGETEVADDVDLNAEVLAEWGFPDLRSFAYPYGDVARPAKHVLGGQFSTLRALHHGLIETGTDLNQAPGVGIEGEDGEAVALRWLREAAARKAWLILYTHDVREEPSPFGCTPAAFGRLVDEALDLGCHVVTVAEGARRIGA